LDRHAAGSNSAIDERLVRARSIDVGAADGRAILHRVRLLIAPVDVGCINGHTAAAVDTAADEGPIDTGAVELRAPDGLVAGPVHVMGVDGDAAIAVNTLDERWIRRAAVEVGPTDLALPAPRRPVEVTAVDGDSARPNEPGDELPIEVRAVEVGPTDGCRPKPAYGTTSRSASGSCR
jgi:hypothetical protein